MGDWSSDVCTSDLLTSVRLQRFSSFQAHYLTKSVIRKYHPFALKKKKKHEYIQHGDLMDEFLNLALYQIPRHKAQGVGGGAESSR